MKRMVVGAALLAAAPFAAQAQSPLQPGGVLSSAPKAAELDVQQSFNVTVTVPPFGIGSFQTNATFNTGYVLGGTLGYDFLGPRIEVEGVYRENNGNADGRRRRRQRWLHLPAKINVMGNRLLRLPRGSSRSFPTSAPAPVSRSSTRALSARRAQHAVRLSGHGRRWLEHRLRPSVSTWKAATRHDHAQLRHQGTAGGTAYTLTDQPDTTTTSAPC